MSTTQTTTLHRSNPLGSISVSSLELGSGGIKKDNVSHLTHISETRRSVAGSVHKSIDKLPTEVERVGYELEELRDGSAVVSSTEPENAVGAITNSMRNVARIQFASLCYCLFLAGWNDGTTGPLLPRIQEVYHIGFAIGFVSGSALNVYLTDRLGFGKVLVLGSVAQVVGYTLCAPGPPYPVLCLGYVFNGFGIALQDAQANGFVACLKENATAKMGILHAIYGLGALSAPLVATQFSQLPRWSFHYLVSLGVALTNTVVLAAVFKGKSQDECLKSIGQVTVAQSESSSGDKYRQIMSQKVLHLLAFWGMLYVGIEVTIGGWTVTYIQRHRGGGPASGYISSGFFGGLTLGRVALLWVNHKIGERRVIYIYALLAIGLEVTIWRVPSLIGNAVAVSIVGLFLGPMYPILMNQSATLIPPWLLTGSIGWIAGLGQAGSAILPFLTGAIASKYGITALQPFLVAFMGALIVLWALVPKGQRRID